MSTLETNSIGKYNGNNVSIDDALRFKNYNTTERDALTSVAGDIIYNTSTSKIEFYDGSAWQEAGGVDAFNLEFLIVAGGGGGGPGGYQNVYGGGGGAGGLISSVSGEKSGQNTDANLYFAQKSVNYGISIGGGGNGASASVTASGQNGSDTYFGNFTSLGGGAAGAYNKNSTDGGSGGGETGSIVYGNGREGDGTVRQGFGGGDNASNAGGGGGGSGGVGEGSDVNGGDGGNGTTSSITGSSVVYAGGGGGGLIQAYSGGAGKGGGGNGGSGPNAGGNGTANTGGGGGGGGYDTSLGGGNIAGGAGGSGVVILRWATADATIGGTRTGLTDGGVQTDGSDSYIVFTAGTGTVSFS